MLPTKTIEIVKSTIPLLENAGVEATDYFYKRMFEHNPEMKDIFNLSNQATGRQQFALFSAVASYAKNIDNLGTLGGLVERVAHKHTSLHVQPAQYEIIGHHLIETLREMAPDDFTDEVAAAWVEAYGVLAEVLIGRERDLYSASAEQRGGWNGPRLFKVKAKTSESELVTNFTFVPVDGEQVSRYLPGQFIAVKVKPGDADNVEIRQYSLSDKFNTDSYRISVKRESSPQAGMVSNYLHDHVNVDDTVELMPPAGAFFLQHSDKPTVLISAGVGITPMMAMLETMVDKGIEQPILFLHACKNNQQHSFQQRVEILSSTYIDMKNFYWYSESEAQPLDTNGFTGVIDLNAIRESLPVNDGHFYVCGPIEFMRFINLQLRILGVSLDRVHYETFGPHDDI
jgi:nitric oxide dioxygenase